jgi:hypothetical protein
MRVNWWHSGLASLALVLALTGCAGSTGAPSTEAAVPVTDVGSVTGKWTGLLELAGSRDREDFVELTIDGSGAYRAVSARTIGLLDARGKIVVSDGKAHFEGQRGSRATATLYARPASPERALVVVGTTPSGRQFSVRLASADSP